MLATLGAQGSATSLDVVRLVGMDPGAVSQAMRDVEGKGSVVPVQGRFVGRNKPYEMTDAGLALFDRLRIAAITRGGAARPPSPAGIPRRSLFDQR